MGEEILPKKKRGNPNIAQHGFKKGQSGNPSGRAKVDPAVKEFKNTTYKDFISGLQKYGAMAPEELAKQLKKPEMTVFDVMFGNIVQGAMRGDKDARNVLLERLWGKVTEKHEVADLRKELADVSDEKLIQLVKEA